MKSIRVHAFGTPDVLTVEDLPIPNPDEGEVLVKVIAAGVGPWDAWVRSGKSVIAQPLPLTPGSDLSGYVCSVGEGVIGFQVGQGVYGVTNPRFTGAYAEYALAKANMLAPKPARFGHLESASVPVVATTALQMTLDHAQVRPGQRVLIHGAGGSVGAFAVQLAHLAGAFVIGTDVGAALAFASSVGADQVIDVQRERFEAVVAPVDVVLDTVGGETQERSFQILKSGGTLLSSVSAPSAAQASQHGVSARFILVDVTTAALTSVAEQLDSGRLKPRVGAVLPLHEARRAHEMLEGSRPRPLGKIVLSVADDEASKAHRAELEH